jgi:hypothetical protein
MPKLNKPIKKQTFEVIRDQIALILKEELENQAELDSNFKAPEVYINRFINLNHHNIPAINVTTDRASYQNESPKHQLGLYTYQLEFYHKGQSTSKNDASEISARRNEDMVGKARHILMAPEYYNLDFQEQIIGRRYFDDFSIGNPNVTESLAVSMAAMNFNVLAGELPNLASPTPIQGNTTTVLVKDAAYGYEWSFQS